jgi:hypothetical protein
MSCCQSLNISLLSHFSIFRLLDTFLFVLPTRTGLLFTLPRSLYATDYFWGHYHSIQFKQFYF